MDKCQRFLDKLKTPAELRKELVETEAVAEVTTDEAVDALNMLENSTSQEEPSTAEVTKERHVNFGNIGFMRIDTEEDASIDENENGDTVANVETDERRDIVEASKSDDKSEHVENVEDVENFEDIGNVESSDRLNLAKGIVMNVAEACVDASSVGSGEKRVTDDTPVQKQRKSR